MPPGEPPSRSRRRTVPATTIHDVAARAGVSVATVSRVLNGKSVVREETQRQVLEAARTLAYVPNVAARSLSSRRSQTLGIVLPDVHGEFFSEVIRGIDLAARQEGYHILVSGSHSDIGEMLAVLGAVRGRVDGLVVMAPDAPPASLHESLPPDLPLVLLGSGDPARDTIAVDNYGGARAMMRHLLELGHRRIAFVQGPRKNADAKERLRGYRDGLRDAARRAGEEPGARRELDGDFTEEAGAAAAGAALATVPRPTALFAANDSMAVGALSALAAAGVAVPEEMSVAGFDDIPIARYVTPPLTTLRVDVAELGRRALGLLLDAIRQPSSSAPRRETIAAILVARASTRALRTPDAGAPPDREARRRTQGETS